MDEQICRCCGDVTEGPLHDVSHLIGYYKEPELVCSLCYHEAKGLSCAHCGSPLEITDGLGLCNPCERLQELKEQMDTDSQ